MRQIQGADAARCDPALRKWERQVAFLALATLITLKALALIIALVLPAAGT